MVNFFLVVIYYGLVRLILNHWRNYPHILIGLNIGQWYGIALIVTGLIGIIYPDSKAIYEIKFW